VPWDSSLKVQRERGIHWLRELIFFFLFFLLFFFLFISTSLSFTLFYKFFLYSLLFLITSLTVPCNGDGTSGWCEFGFCQQNIFNNSESLLMLTSNRRVSYQVIDNGKLLKEFSYNRRIDWYWGIYGQVNLWDWSEICDDDDVRFDDSTQQSAVCLFCTEFLNSPFRMSHQQWIWIWQ